MNYRPSLWRDVGGRAAHERATAALTGDVDLLLGIDPDTFDATVTHIAGPSVIATTRRVVHSASVHDWSGIAWSRSDGIVRGSAHDGLAILDRIGGGDGFASGVIHGLMSGRPAGDTSSFDAADVERLAGGSDADVVR